MRPHLLIKTHKLSCQLVFTRTPKFALQMHESPDSGKAKGAVRVPHPQDLHGSLLPPRAKEPERHGVHGASGSAVSTPCPGTHVQCVRLLAPVNAVVLFSGHARHAALLLVAAYQALAHTVHTPCGDSVVESETFACDSLPYPGGHRHSSSVRDPASETSPRGQDTGVMAPEGQ